MHVTGNPDLLTNLKTSPLILIRAEKNNEYRFHHFVQETLQTIQPINLGSSIQALKRKCFNFYLTKSRYKEALDLALDINEEQLISASFAEFRLQCFNQAMLRPISDTLDRLMISAISDSPIHKLTSAWVEVYKGNTEGMINKLNSIDVNTIPRNSLSEYWVLKSYEYYVIAKPNEAIKASSKAFELGFENKYAEGYYYIFRLASLHSTGQMKQAFTEGLQALSMTSSDLVKTQILLVLCYISRFESKQQRQYDYANALLKLAEENQNYEAITNALCFLGEYHYNLGELKIAEKLLKRAHELKHHTIGIIGISITWLYSKTLFNFGRTKFAHSIIQTQIDKLTKDGNWFILDFLKGMRAHLNLFSNTESSKEWLNNTEFNPHLPITEVYSPLLTKHLVEVTLGVESVNFLQSATDSLSKGNYKRPEAECLLSYAIYCLKKKDKTSAKKQISRALRLMPFHSFKQIYDDYAQHSAELKKTVLKLADSGVAKGVASTVKLTNREYQVAQLYDSRMTDQEIANTLGISLATVKRHNVNIFNKLQVRSKRQAIIELKKV